MVEEYVDKDIEVTFDEVVAALGPEEAGEFDKIMKKVQYIIENPEKVQGLNALQYASQLAALRTKIGLRAQYYKTEKPTNTVKRRKNLLMTMYSALEENINTLKLMGRIEAKF